MSGTTSAAVRFEDHFGPIVPESSPRPASSTPPAPHDHQHTARLRDLVHQMRQCVVTATAASDVATKVELWESYRKARSEALALLASVAEGRDTPRLRSV